MADLTLTAANVVKGTTAKTKHGVLGAVVTAGQTVYLDTTTATYKLADCDSATAAARYPSGIALNGGAIGQPVEVLYEGPITIGGTVAAGVPYFQSGTAGGICPAADMASGDYNTFIGWGQSTTVIDVTFVEAGVVQ